MPRRRSRQPDPVDFHVGQNIRARRRERGLSQTVLGDSVGVSFKQIQKYESGANRIGAGRLYEIAAALDTSIEDLFDGAPVTAPAGSGDTTIRDITAAGIDRESERLIEAYYSIQDPQMRQHFLSLLRTIADSY